MPTTEEIEAANKAAAQQPVSHLVFDTQANRQEVANPPAENAGKTAEELEAEKNKSLFSESLFAEDNTNQNNNQNSPDAETIAKLTAAGYKVEKAEVVDENAETQKKLDFHKQNIDEATAFIQKDDKSIVTEKLKNDRADLYTNTGRGHLINSEEFNIEVEAELEANYENSAILKMFAENLRNLIKQNVIDKNDADRKRIVAEVENKGKLDIEERTKKLDGSFDTIYKEGYLGLKFERQEVIDARNNVINGNFTNEIKNNPEILAKLALVYYQEQKLVDKVGQPTYGEGVANTYHQLNGGDKSNSKTSPAAAAQNMGSASQGTFQVNKWLNLADDEDDKGKKVI